MSDLPSEATITVSLAVKPVDCKIPNEPVEVDEPLIKALAPVLTILPVDVRVPISAAVPIKLFIVTCAP